MKQKTGITETSSAIVIFSLSPTLLVLIGENSALLGSGAWINCLICFGISLIMLLTLKWYFSVCPDKSIIDSSAEALGTFPSFIIAIVFLILIFAAGAFSVSIFSNQISSLTLGSVSFEHCRVLFCVSAAVCAWLGIEAVTRQSYVILFFGLAVIALLVASSYRGINFDNIYPLLGNSFKSTFSNYLCMSMYMGIAPFLLICDLLKFKKNPLGCAIRSVAGTFLIAVILFLLYTLTVPYPLGKLFSFSMEAIFASASSGELLHRFELLLASLFTLFAVVSSAFSLIVCAHSLAKLCRFPDIRPFVLILAVIFFNLSGFEISPAIYLSVCLSLTVLAVFAPLIVSVINFKRTNRG